MINKLRSCSENLANALTCRVFILTSCFVLYVVYVGSFHRDQQIVVSKQISNPSIEKDKNQSFKLM